MKLVFLLLVVLLGNVLADNVQLVDQTKSASLSNENIQPVAVSKRDTTSDQPANKIKRSPMGHPVYRFHNDNVYSLNKPKGIHGAKKLIKTINKEAAEKRKMATMLGKKRKSELLKLAKTNKKSMSSLLKMSNITFISLKEKALASQNITTESTQLILQLVNKTIQDKRQTLQEGAENIRDLTKSFIEQVNTYADTSLAKIYDALQIKDVKEANNVLQNELKMVVKVADTCNHKIRTSYGVSAKEVMQLANNGATLTLEMAENQVKKFEGLKSDNKQLQNYIEFVSKEIYNLAKTSSDKYMELALDCLNKLKQLAYNSERSLTLLALLEIKFGKAVVEDDAEIKKELQEKIDNILSKFEDADAIEFNKFIKSVKESTNAIMLDVSRKIGALNGCPPTDSSCLSNFDESTD